MGSAQGAMVRVAGKFGNAEVEIDTRGLGPASVYVHGWGCSRHDFDAVAEVLSSSNRIVSIDLPYHGMSLSSNDRLTMADMGAIVAEVVRSQGLANVALLGHSMGSAVAIEAAKRLGSTVRRVIAVDGLTYLGVYPRQDTATVEGVLGSFANDFPEAIRGFVDLYTPGASQTLKDSIAAVMLTRDPGKLIPLLGELLRWDMDAALHGCSVPISVLASSAFLDPDALTRYGARFEITQTDLGGHFFFMENPKESAREIVRLLTS